MKSFARLSFLFILSLSLGFGTFVFTFPNQSSADELSDKEAQLKRELQKIEEEQAALQKTLDQQKGQTATIQRDVDVLNSQIKKAELEIQKKRLEISSLGSEIALRDNTVKELDDKMDRSREALAELIKQTHESDNYSLVEIVLGSENLSDFFSNIDSYNELQKQLETLFDKIREIRGITEEEKAKLESKQNAELDLKKEIEANKATVAVKKNEKDGLLSVSKQAEATYEQVLKEKQAQAASIRAALFQLRDSAGIQFGDALKYANEASKATGVRAAFILAILKQESDLGKNVGTCNRPGDPEEKKWYNIMPGPKDNSWRDDQTIFLRITKALGIDPETQPLSCPWAGGWGGAMGPSQFIPYTWQAYESRIAAVVGVSIPNPWNPEHAVVATSLYVKDLGAAAGGYTAERTAALKYYAGNNWSLPQNAFYGNSVMQHAESIQKQIDFLNDVEN